MITFNITNLCKLRGIVHPHKALVRAGISQKVASGYLDGRKKWILLEHVEILCRLLNCRPDHLFTWQPDSQQDDVPENPLQAIRQKALPDSISRLQTMSVEEVEGMMGGTLKA